jgi:hypothetical protein
MPGHLELASRHLGVVSQSKAINEKQHTWITEDDYGADPIRNVSRKQGSRLVDNLSAL